MVTCRDKDPPSSGFKAASSRSETSALITILKLLYVLHSTIANCECWNSDVLLYTISCLVAVFKRALYNTKSTE